MKRRSPRVLANMAAVLIIVGFGFPVFWMATTALKTPENVRTYDPQFIPTDLTFQHFRTAIDEPLFWNYWRNSVLATVTAVLLALLIGVLGAYAAARMRFRGRRAFMITVLVVMITPWETLFVPMFIIMRDANLLNQLPGLMAVYFIMILPLTMWLLRSFIVGVPVELEEAAMIDGCSRAQAVRKVTLPLLAPGLVAASLFGFITVWNEFLFALVLMRDEDKLTLPVWIASFQSAFGTDWGATMAASTMFTIPLLVVFLIVQRRAVAGLTAGAVKG